VFDSETSDWHWSYKRSGNRVRRLRTSKLYLYVFVIDIYSRESAVLHVAYHMVNVVSCLYILWLVADTKARRHQEGLDAPVCRCLWLQAVPVWIPCWSAVTLTSLKCCESSHWHEVRILCLVFTAVHRWVLIIVESFLWIPWPFFSYLFFSIDLTTWTILKKI